MLGKIISLSFKRRSRICALLSQALFLWFSYTLEWYKFPVTLSSLELNLCFGKQDRSFWFITFQPQMKKFTMVVQVLATSPNGSDSWKDWDGAVVPPTGKKEIRHVAGAGEIIATLKAHNTSTKTFCGMVCPALTGSSRIFCPGSPFVNWLSLVLVFITWEPKKRIHTGLWLVK